MDQCWVACLVWPDEPLRCCCAGLRSYIKPLLFHNPIPSCYVQKRQWSGGSLTCRNIKVSAVKNTVLRDRCRVQFGQEEGYGFVLNRGFDPGLGMNPKVAHLLHLFLCSNLDLSL